MVLQTERYPGGYQQQSYDAYQGPNGNFSSFQGVTQNSSPYSAYPQASTYPSPHAPQNQFGRPSGGDYYGNGAGAYLVVVHGPPLADMEVLTMTIRRATEPTRSCSWKSTRSRPWKPTRSRPWEPTRSRHGSPQHGYGGALTNHFDKPSHGHHGYGGGATNHFDKPSHGQHGYGGGGSPNYGYGQGGMNQGYQNQKPSWILKGLDDEE
ncbi:hypothetical protein OSB04_018426 [Centaurea solstitialis]|uniref:Uncharacterized protein n=1 Tax=Centaurea solstitialis TaxID=347529 RepID=A0AA38TFQ8_9ASTR|nr:hypothetical protein OSB04_018426 [Centaurea solstitialis]